jgi:CheY-specific phosphatase CheX
MEVAQEDIRSVAEDVWSSVLGLAIAPAQVPTPRLDGQDSLLASVHISGAWEGTVLLECAAALMSRAAAAMLEMAPEDLGADEVHDVLGELANIIGGNIKGLLPGPSSLSLPTVVQGRDVSIFVPGAEELAKVFFECEREHFSVTLLKRNSLDPGATSCESSSRTTVRQCE